MLTQSITSINKLSQCSPYHVSKRFMELQNSLMWLWHRQLNCELKFCHGYWCESLRLKETTNIKMFIYFYSFSTNQQLLRKFLEDHSQYNSLYVVQKKPGHRLYLGSTSEKHIMALTASTIHCYLCPNFFFLSKKKNKDGTILPNYKLCYYPVTVWEYCPPCSAPHSLKFENKRKS